MNMPTIWHIAEWSRTPTEDRDFFGRERPELENDQSPHSGSQQMLSFGNDFNSTPGNANFIGKSPDVRVFRYSLSVSLHIYGY